MSSLMVFDALELAMRGRVLKGTVRASEFLRLCHGLPAAQETLFSWEFAGHHDAEQGRCLLDISAQGQLGLVCQRCLQVFMFDLQVSNTLELIPSQEQMQAIEALEDQGVVSDTEYLLADRKLDMLELLEDELILALPYAPRHDACTQASSRQQSDTDDESPFAVLAKLRKN